MLVQTIQSFIWVQTLVWFWTKIFIVMFVVSTTIALKISLLFRFFVAHQEVPETLMPRFGIGQINPGNFNSETLIIRDLRKSHPIPKW